MDGTYFSEIVADGTLALPGFQVQTADAHQAAPLRGTGVILATPSGSRLYSRAAGGALVYPFVQCFQVVPLNPMSLSFRPVILAAETEITLRVC